jgi:hypothetical protein
MPLPGAGKALLNPQNLFDIQFEIPADFFADRLGAAGQTVCQSRLVGNNDGGLKMPDCRRTGR